MKLKTLADALREAAERTGNGEVAIGYRTPRNKWRTAGAIALIHNSATGRYTLYPNVDGSPSQDL